MHANRLAIPLAVAALAVPAHAVVITTGTGVGADSYVRNGSSASQNFGGDTELLAKTTTGSGYHRVIYLRFDLSAYAGLPVTDATLSLAQLAGTGTGSASQQWSFGVFGIPEAAEDWVEGAGTGASPSATGIKFAGQPAPQFASLNGTMPVGASAPLLGTFTITGMSSLGAVSQMSSQALTDFIAADSDKVVSLGVYRLTSESAGGGTAYHAFASDEHATVAAPSLTFASVPSPGGIAMMGVAGTLVVFRRNKRGTAVLPR